MEDEDYMRRALELAAYGAGHVSPNPMVGAVIVRDGRVIAEGYHHRIGDLHAERDALSRCEGPATGATLYVTLEPCCHYGKQPPCVDAILEAGISRVVVGAGDPNPLVAGKGIRILREHGVQVDEGVLEAECRELDRVFFHYIQHHRPYVVMKYAMSLDGKIACASGASRWITGERARRRVHEQRSAMSAVMVGVGTVLADDPLLTCRIEGGVDPLRIVCDTRLRTPLAAQLVRTAREVPTLIATCVADGAATAPYRQAGCEVLTVPEEGGHVDLDALMDALGEREVDGLVLEGGARLNAAALEAGIVQEVDAYIAPKLLGGAGAPSPVAGAGFATPDEAVRLRDVHVERLGDDVLLSGKVAR